MVNVAVIGLGNIGQYHLSCYNDLKDVKILGVADVAEERVSLTAAKYTPPHAFTDYHQVLALPEVDAVSVCLPNCLHAPVTIDALRAGKHVLVEKPMAMNAQECEAMVATARENGKTLAVSFNYRWNLAPDSWYLKHLIDQGRLGSIYYIRSVSLRRRTFLRGTKSWFSDKKVSGGAALIDMGPHMVDLAMWLAGDYDPLQVSGVTRTALMTDTDVDDFSSALIRLRSGVTLLLESTWEAFLRPSIGITVLGTQGGAYLDLAAPQGKRLTLFGADGNTLTETTPVEIVLPELHEATVHEHFVRSIQAHAAPQNSAACGLAVMRVLDAVYRSSETGRDVVIGG
jgi:predicted dehydrogenase